MIRDLLISRPLSDDETAPWTTADERLRAAGFGTPARRAEFLTWRTLVRRRLGADIPIDYDAAGAPALPGTPWHLSVAHCAGLVAVCLCDVRCAVDAEPSERDFGRVVSRVSTPAERALSDDPRWPGVLWCAKECLYKYARRRGADFLRDLRVTDADLARGAVEGDAAGERVALSVRFDEGYTLVSIP